MSSPPPPSPLSLLPAARFAGLGRIAAAAAASVVVATLGAACAPAAAGEGEGEGEGDAFAPIDGSFVVDDVDPARPVTVKVPAGYDPQARAYSFVVVLAGYGVTGAQFEQFTGFDAFAAANDLVFAFPEGRVDASGKSFWNASDACCDFARTGVDDGAYLSAVVAEVRSVARVDKVYAIGHSNGGFMAQRLACDHAEDFDGVVSVSAALPNDCHPSRPIAVLESHGTADTTISYDGGSVAAGVPSYPSAEDTAAAWAANNGCSGSVDDDDIDLDAGLAGADTHVRRYTGCAASTELWTTVGGQHAPNGVTGYFDFLLGFLTGTR